MKAVILAAGKGTRMHPLQTPKPLLKLAGKPVIQRTLEQLEGLVEETVVVVHYSEEEVSGFLKTLPHRVRIVRQQSLKGTMDALSAARPFLNGRFLALNGDDVYSRADMEECLRHPRAILVRQVSDVTRFGIVHGKTFLEGIEEKPAASGSSLANTGLYVLDGEVFGHEIRESKRGELELTDAVGMLLNVRIVEAREWFPLGYPWDLLEANEALMKSLPGKLSGTVEEGAVLKGNVQVGEGSVVKSGAYIEGPVHIGRGCVIGPNCFLRAHTSLGDNCKIGNAVEVKNSVLGDSVHISHLSYLGDSILDSGINIGAGTIAANLRHDGRDVHATVKGRLLSTGRRKFGCVIGRGVHTGIGTRIYPGRFLDRDTLPGEVIK